MKFYRKMLSAVMSFTLAGVSVASASATPVYAEDMEIVNLYDNTIFSESKEESGDIYITDDFQEAKAPSEEVQQTTATTLSEATETTETTTAEHTATENLTSVLTTAKATTAKATTISTTAKATTISTTSKATTISTTSKATTATTPKATTATTTAKATATSTTAKATATTTAKATTTATKATTTTAKATTTTTSKATTTSTTATSTATATSAQTTVSQVPFNVFDIYNAHKKYIASLTATTTATAQSATGTTETTVSTDIQTSLSSTFQTTATTETTATTVSTEISVNLIQRQASGIDVSAWQPNIDWAKVKADGIEFAICRAGYGRYASQKDSTFDYNIRNAQANGIATGVYWYSYATTPDEAKLEAEVCYQIIKDYNYTFPVYFDIEDPSQVNLSSATISAMVDAFCSTIQAKGYRAGVYSYVNFLSTKVYDSILSKYDVWIANFDVAVPNYTKTYGMWQYSAKGGVNGINGDVDLDISYINYPYLISPQTYVDTPATTFNRTQRIKTTTNTTTNTANVVAKGIDVSEWQGDIDWNAVKNSGAVDFAIIRAGYGKVATQKDVRFDYNVKTAQSLGIACGAYWYSYATTVEEAKIEAELFYQTIKDYKFEYPVFLDIEDAVQLKLTPAQVSEIVEAFCSTLEAKKYFVGVTTYSNFVKSQILESTIKKYSLWVAHYGVAKPDYSGAYGMWQYSNQGTVSGINGGVDLDYSYIKYPLIMKEYHLNGF